MSIRRPILISTVQFHDDLVAGRVSQVELIAVAQRLGADGIELRDAYWHDPKYEDREVPQARRRLDELGLHVTYATAATLFPADPGGIEVVRRHVATAAALGSPIVRLFHGPAPLQDDDAPWIAARVELGCAAEHGIVVAVENFWRGPGNRAAEIRSLLDALPDRALGTNVDVGNYYQAGEDPAAAVRLLADRIVYTQLKDSTGDPDGTYLGGGRIPLAAVLDELDRLPQKFAYCFEFGGGGEPEARIARSLAYLRARASGGA